MKRSPVKMTTMLVLPLTVIGGLAVLPMKYIVTIGTLALMILAILLPDVYILQLSVKIITNVQLIDVALLMDARTPSLIVMIGTLVPMITVTPIVVVSIML